MQSDPDSHVLPSETRIGRTALRVSDLDEMVEFYREVVGLSVLTRSETTAILGVEKTPLLVLERDEAALARDRSGAGLYHTAFRVPSRSALGDALGRIRDRWQLSGAADHDVSEALYLTDPEGSGVEIYRDFPREEWPIADGGRVRIGTYPLDLEPVEAAGTGELGVPAGTDIGHVHLEVTSLETFSDFYVDTLGFDVQTTVPDASFVSAGGYHHHIGANTWHHRTGTVEGRGLSWFEVVLPEAQTLETIRDQVAGSQFTVTKTDDGISIIGPDEIEIRFSVET
ncbi:VOC family protein (plasmid) [Halococcus dombrowskii]|uniref:VOC family protein n=1 Tax=Halococcus dombrowskii TaxID=179637 RepID=A0AAV3SHG5_HALDO|nr:VOC family protein [Halococcus dombrowskii]UOO97300.1 VOC family protein [Halococcus dombrowskii]